MPKTNMEKNGNRGESDLTSGERRGGRISANHRSIIAVGLIALVAFVVRFVFAYGISADNSFALSGGAKASEHLHTIVSILNGGLPFGSDGVFGYPFGSSNVNPIVVDLILSGIASIGTSLGMAATKAASLTLGTFAIACGTLAVIAAFYLGKEVVGTKKAGYLTALFVAFCPAVISQTVFSNGTETGWTLLLFILLATFLVKGVRMQNVPSGQQGRFSEVMKANSGAFRYALLSGAMLALIVLSTNGFRPVFVTLILAMATMMVVDRFRYADARASVAFFSIVLLVGAVAATGYYIPAQLWDSVASGTVLATAISVVVCIFFASLQRKPWIYTMPAFVIALVAMFVSMALLLPDHYGNIVNGNNYYSSSVAAYMGSSLSISSIAINFGLLSMWFSAVTVAVMIYRLPKNISSHSYLFTIVLLFAGTVYGSRTDVLAAIFSPAYALGFAFVMMWLFDSVDFKTYFASLKTADIGSIWKRIFNPVPFASILAVVFLICAPGALYALDAGISTNESGKYGGLDVGSGYFVRTDGDWNVNGPLSTYAGVDKNGSLVTWIDYSADAAAYGGFDSVTGPNGAGAVEMANIMLSNGLNGSSTAVMFIYMLRYAGDTQEVKTALMGAGLSEDDYGNLFKVINDPASHKEEVTGDIDKYGLFGDDVSDENIIYIYGKTYLTDRYGTSQISSFYDEVVRITGKGIGHFMVNSSMLPIYYGYSSIFSTMASINGYILTDAYGTVTEFLEANYFTLYQNGVYGYKDAMCDTFIWRAYVGMSPAEAGFTGMAAGYQYVSKLMLSDGSYVPHPGYGLANYTVDYDHWYVMYNSDSEATLSSDGWVKMRYYEAVAAQEADGGLINYLSGLPVFLRYVPNGAGTIIEGTVIDSESQPLKGIRVNVLDSHGSVASTAVTDDTGKYDVLVLDKGSKIQFLAGSSAISNGIEISTVPYVEGIAVYDETVGSVSISGSFVDSDGNAVQDSEVAMKLKGTVSGKEYTLENGSGITVAGMKFSATVVPDVYEVTVTSNDGSVTYTKDGATISVQSGESAGYKVGFVTNQVNISVKDENSNSLGGNIIVTMTDTVSGVVYKGTTDVSGKVKFILPAGVFVIGSEDDYVSISPVLEVSKTTTETVKFYAASEYAFTGFPANRAVMFYGYGYQTSAVADGSGSVTIKLPIGTAGDAKFYAYATDGISVYAADTDNPNAVGSAAVNVTGTLRNSSSGGTSGVILFSKDGFQFPVAASSDGKYSVVLGAGDYIVYANNGSDAYIGKRTVVDGEALDIEMTPGEKISGKSSWKSANPMAYQNLKVKISDTDMFWIMTDGSGAFSYYVPSELSGDCKTIATLPAGGNLNYGDSVFEKEFESSIGAVCDRIDVKNSTGFDIKVGDTEIPDGSIGSVEVKGASVTITVDTPVSGTQYYWKGSLAIRLAGNMEVTAGMIEPKEYHILTVNCENESDVVTLTTMDGGSYSSIKTDESTEIKTYYVGAGEQISVKVGNSDSDKVFYEAVKMNIDQTVNPSLSSYATLNGYVGYGASGTVALSEGGDVVTVAKIENGRYEGLLVPVGKEYDISASVSKDGEKYEYVGTRGIGETDLESGGTYTYNIASVSSDVPSSDKIAATADITEMVNAGDRSSVKFSLEIDSNSETEKKTYVLSGGSDWFDLKFYDGDTQITTLTLDVGEIRSVRGEGTIIMDRVAIGSEDLSVKFTDLNGTVAHTSVLKDETGKWIKDIESVPSKVNFGTDVIGTDEYSYAIEIVNGNNYTKRFQVRILDDVTEGWFVTYMFDGMIVESSTGISVEVVGYSVAKVYVKLTGKLTSEQPAPTDINVEVKAETGESLITDEATGVTIEENVAVVVLKVSTSLEITKYGASGRGVFDSKGDTPAYIWVLVAVIITMLFLVTWVAVRRGVFSRKK